MSKVIENELISVVIPVFNVEKFLRKCIESVLSQTYTNIQILLINDGSTDSSGRICEEYEAKDTRVQCIHQKNAGLSEARNTGINLLKGKYVTFIDSDDYVSIYFIERLYKAIVEKEADISISNFIRVKENEILNDSKEVHIELQVFDKMESLAALYSNDISYQFTTAWGKLYKSEIFDDIRYPKGRNYEDAAIAHLIYDNITTVVYADIKQYFYLTRENSITSSETYVKNDKILAVEDRMNYFKLKGYGNLYLKAKEAYFITLMGIYVRLSSNENSVEELKKKYYSLVKENFNSNNDGESVGFRLRSRIFLLSPKLYNQLLKTTVNFRGIYNSNIVGKKNG